MQQGTRGSKVQGAARYKGQQGTRCSKVQGVARYKVQQGAADMVGTPLDQCCLEDLTTLTASAQTVKVGEETELLLSFYRE